MSLPIKKSPLQSSFIPRLAVYFILPLIVLLIIIVIYSQSLHHQSMLELVGDRNLRAVHSATSAIQNEFIRYQQDLIRYSAGNHDSLFLDAFDRGFASLNCTDQTLAEVNSNESTESIIQIGKSLCGLLSGQSTDAIAYQLNGDLGQNSIWFGIQADSNTVVVAGLSLKPFFTRVLGETFRSENMVVQVYDADHKIIYETGTAQPSDHNLYHESILTALSGGEGVIYPSGMLHLGDHGSHVIAYEPIEPANWVLVTDEAWIDVTNTSLELTQSLPLILIPLLLAAVAGLFAGYRQIVLPLTRLQESARKLGEGDRTALSVPVGGISEISTLQSVLQETTEKMDEARADLQEYVGAMTAGVEAERKQIALDLHDDALQDTIALKQALQTTSSQKSKLLTSEAQKVIDKLRGIIRGLRPPYLEDVGLYPALEMLANEVSSQQTVEVSQVGEPVRLHIDQEMAMYRIAQHAVTNSIRYAKATRTTIQLRFDEHSVELLIQDNGSGFELPNKLSELSHSGHYGILGMKERAEMVGGTFHILSNPGEGTRIRVTISETQVENN